MSLPLLHFVRSHSSGEVVRSPLIAISPLLVLAPHLAIFGLLLSCCCRSKTATRKPVRSEASWQRTPSAETPLEGSTPPTAATTAKATTPLQPTTPATNTTPTTNPSSQQPPSSSPQTSTKRRRNAASTVQKAAPTGQNSNPEEDMTPPAVKKKKNESRTKRLRDEEMAKARHSQKRKPTSDEKKNKDGEAGEEARKVAEQKTQEGQPEPIKDPKQLKVEPEIGKNGIAIENKKGKPKDLPFFSRERIKRKLGIKSDPEKSTKPVTKAPVKRPNWHEAVPESQLADDLTDFDVTKHTQDETKDTQAD
ncbi:hypothetical protein PRIPAC_89493 [Pristionchus pacificus]|uniref:Uncharacterized protein n=1 Tax=Pristionchus pacificus TaxID=54126 RepID=A0A8R1YSU0_PRIPA|nr:hypothetical protein PRIPAC_89493 [Pristionchus pacificus]|eukprot:PDM60456.1 hypothetical protein PRIPAC_53434 [Pristionchus pacificus]